MGETNYTSRNLAIASHIQFLEVNSTAIVAMKFEFDGTFREMVGTLFPFQEKFTCLKEKFT